MPAAPQDPFDLLGLPPRFDLDSAAMQRAYLLRSAAAHPDLAQDPAHDPAAADSAAALNRARQQLEDPESRADALLARLGGPAREADRSLPAGFLPEIMDVREQMEAAIAAGDAAATAHWHQWAMMRRAEHIASVTASFASLSSPPAQGTLKEIRRSLNAWRYIERMLEQLAAAER
jgi:molecular chaperone HscB